jgi:hypothetical protein
MRQSRMMSLVEAVVNLVVGLVVAVATQIVVFPILGLQATLAQNLKLALVFTGVSRSRGAMRCDGYPSIVPASRGETCGRSGKASTSLGP